MLHLLTHSSVEILQSKLHSHIVLASGVDRRVLFPMTLKMEPMDWKSALCLRLIIFGVVVANVHAQYSKPPEQAILERIFDDGRYDHRVRPLNAGNASDPVLVSVNFFLRRIDKVDDLNQEFSVQLTYRQKWRDDRLSYSSPGVKHVSLLNPQNRIWRPDTFFSNEKEGNYHDMMSRNEFVRISPSGDVLQSARISLKLACPMNFRKFPLDKQTCSMRLASYGYTTIDVKYEWEKENPVQVQDHVHIASNFRLDGITTSYCDSTTSTGSYSCLRVDMGLKRDFRYYLIHVYIPTTMMTLVSWVAFWISIQAVTARILLSLVTLLVLSIQVSDVNKNFPVSGRTKSVDWWTGILLTFVFAALLESATVHYLACRNERKSSNKSRQGSQTNVANVEVNAGHEQDIPLKDVNSGDDVEKENQGGADSKNSPNVTQRMKNATRNYLTHFDSQSEKMDGVCRILFPVLFIIFNIIYWPLATA